MPEGIVIVTGGSRGIGEAVVVQLAAAGYEVAVLSRSGAAPAGFGIACDVTDEASLCAAVARAAERGPVVGLVNNAGLHKASASAALPTAEFEETMRINATAVMMAGREAYPHLKQAGGGLIVNLGSFFDKLGVPENLAYCASKAAVGAITRCWAVEWARDGIRVINVAPGYIATDLNRAFLANEKVQAWLGKRVPVGRPGTTDEVAALIVSLFTTRIGFLTGETIYLDGGQGMNH
jgi:NAD(P)-dependent dehydrogenase (short-subunit alcohol dehydrogenase family)